MLYTLCVPHIWGLPWWFSGKESIGICSAGDAGSVLGWDDPMEEGVATHSSVLAERISWTKRILAPVRLQSLGPQRVRYD